jgi:hypothetical protein
VHKEDYLVLLTDMSLEMCADDTTSKYWCHHNKTMDNVLYLEKFHVKQISLLPLGTKSFEDVQAAVTKKASPS